MDRVKKGDQEARFTKDRMGFEINTLGEHFNGMLDSVIEQQKEAESQKLQKRSL